MDAGKNVVYVYHWFLQILVLLLCVIALTVRISHNIPLFEIFYKNV